MTTRNDSTLLKGLEFRNSANSTGIRDIEVHMTGDGTAEIRIERTDNVPEDHWRKLMSRVAADLRAFTDTESTNYGPPSEHARQSTALFRGSRCTIGSIPVENINQALVAMIGILNMRVEIKGEQGIDKPLMPDAAVTIAIRELGLKPFVDELKAKQSSHQAL